jgi:hypothetical protein
MTPRVKRAPEAGPAIGTRIDRVIAMVRSYAIEFGGDEIV